MDKADKFFDEHVIVTGLEPPKKPKSKNLWSKTRLVDNPYMIVYDGDFEYRILKAYQTRAAEETNRYARWLCAVKSPYTFGSWEYGDTYVNDVPMTRESGSILDQRALDEAKEV